MTCNCTHGCQKTAEETGPYPTLCDLCGLTVALNGSKCGLPYTPPTYKPLEPLAPITDEQKNAAMQDFVAENGF